MPAPSYLSSFLWMQQLRGAEAFAQRFPGEWLVWEPGRWQAPAVNVRTTLTFGATGPGDAARNAAAGDFLCFHLGVPDARSFAVGREVDNDIVINDGTVSRQHVVFAPASGRWLVRPQGGRAATISGVAVGADGAVIRPGQTLLLGGATLSFHDTSTLLKRLAQAQAQ